MLVCVFNIMIDDILEDVCVGISCFCCGEIDGGYVMVFVIEMMFNNRSLLK